MQLGVSRCIQASSAVALQRPRLDQREGGIFVRRKSGSKKY
jgi:hypothetical protein